MVAVQAEDPGSPPAPRLARIWRFGPVVLDEAALALTVAGRAVGIERRPLELLALLLRHAGEVVTKDEILDALWPDRVVTEASLTKCVARLRAALGDGEQKLVRTVHGYGYRLIAEIAVEERPRGAPERPAAVGLEPGMAVPHRPSWRLVERLGTGGFGDAWLGEQARTRERRVFKFGQDSQRLAALRREITVSRLLRDGLGPRDDLTPVIDWNLEELPYFIELPWSGEGSLADWAARQGGLGTVPLALRLDLVARLADALAAAHSMGVLHRDLKPANILIHLDGEGRPRIRLADFGSGRLLDPGRLDALGITRLAAETRSGDETSGTLIYCAPELIEGRMPTVQADIYALGVMLYQMAVGDLKRVLAPGWEDEVADPLLRDDIAAAAAGDPARRLADAAELARRLRGLEARRAEARRDAETRAAAERTRRALERAQARRAPLLILVLVLLAGLALSSWLFLRADAASRAARREAARAQAVTRFLTDDLLSAANPFLSADPNIRVKDLLASAADGIDHRFPAGSLDRAAIEAAVGTAYAGLSDPAHAQPLLRAALAARRRALGDGDPQTQSVRLALAALAERMLDPDGMRRAGQEVLDAHPADAETELTARFYVLIGGCGINGNAGDCAARLRPLLDEARRRLGPRHGVTLKIESELAYRLGDAQRTAEAIPMARETVALTEAVYGPDHLLVQDRRFHLAGVLVQAGQADEAIAILGDLRRRLLAISGTETLISARVANQLGMAYQIAGRHGEALEALEIALDYSRRTQGEASALAIGALSNMASSYAELRRFPEAIEAARRVVGLQRQVGGPDAVDTLWSENNLAYDTELAGDLAAAEAGYRDLYRRAQRVFTHGEWDLGQFAFRLGEVLAAEGRGEEARAPLTEAVALLGRSLGPEDRHTRRAQAALDALSGR